MRGLEKKKKYFLLICVTENKKWKFLQINKNQKMTYYLVLIEFEFYYLRL